MPVSLAYHFGYLSVLILALGLAFVFFRWPRGIQYTFSQHVAPKNSSSVFYSLLFIVTLSLLLIFFFSYFILAFQLPAIFGVILIISCATQILCTFVPERGEIKAKIHRIFAGISALCLPPLLAILSVWPTIDGFDQIVSRICLLAMIAILCLALFTQLRKTHALILQIAYNVAFFVPILFLAY